MFYFEKLRHSREYRLCRFSGLLHRSILRIITDRGEDMPFLIDSQILNGLLLDKTTKTHIIWATDDYKELGPAYGAECPITVDLITGEYAEVILPRIAKRKQNQISRTKAKAEVSTPAWICNRQNNDLDSAWFGIPEVFNHVTGKTWTATLGEVNFPEKKKRGWRDYVDAKRMEIACGEAPYLVSRYDMETGREIQVPERIGLLDRKLRIVGEHTDQKEDWLRWAFRALESVYGFEWQGDSLLIARENILYSFAEHMRYKFQEDPSLPELKHAANIIAWNIWQMDGLTFTVPSGTIRRHDETDAHTEEKDSKEKNVFCKIRDWRSKQTLVYGSLMKENI